MKLTNRNLTLTIDLFFALVLLPALMMLLPVDKWIENNMLLVVMLLGWLYTTYAINRLLTVPMLFGEKRNPIVAIAIIAVSILIAYLFSEYQLTYSGDRYSKFVEFTKEFNLPEPPDRRHSPSNRILKQAAWFLYVMVTSFSFVVALLSELHKKNEAQQNILFEKKKAELALYKAQINPHFLFNTLNTLLGLIITKSERAEEAFIQFTNMMKYMCSSSTEEHVALRTEIEYIDQYIEIQRLRLNENTIVNFDHELDVKSCSSQIAPMILITFVENAIKYGASSHEKSNIDIRLTVKDSLLVLKTSNRKHQRTSEEKGSGIGIQNCRKRLEMLYPSNFTLFINEDDDKFDVSLTIKLT